MKKIGKLEFYSLFDPILVDGEDFLPALNEFFNNSNGLRISLSTSMNKIKLELDKDSDRILKYEREDGSLLLLLSNADGSFGFSNINAYLPDTLQKLNGREVNFIVDDNKIEIEPVGESYKLFYTRNNCCSISNDDVNKVCKPGSSETCIFLSVSSDGFECLKFDSPSARMLLHRLKNGNINAKRIGDCELAGRKE